MTKINNLVKQEDNDEYHEHLITFELDPADNYQLDLIKKDAESVIKEKFQILKQIK